MRVLVTGGAGCLGRRLGTDRPAGTDLHLTWHRTALANPAGESHQVDLVDGDATRALIERLRPEVVIHTAYAVADGERAIVDASANVTRACASVGAALVHLSSDVVFDGEHAPYAETDHPLPISSYGRHKAAAEAAVRTTLPDAAIVRTSLITWAEPLDARSAWIAEALRSGDPITLFTDEIRCPVRLDDLSAQLWEIVDLPVAERSGVWHLVGSEALSRSELGLLIADHYSLDGAAISTATSRDQPDPRPRDLRLTAERAAAVLRNKPRTVRSLFTLE